MSAERLRDALEARRGSRRRITLEEVEAAFGEVAPALRHHPTARSELARWLTALEGAGAIRLPSGRVGWDALQSPRLPHWVELPAKPAEEPVVERAKRTAWHPSLERAAALPRLSRDELDVLERAQEYLATGDVGRVLTARERSLRLFGDEKRLEALARGRLFAEGGLSHALLRCREVYAPFVFEEHGHGDLALAVENKDTWRSACDAVRELGARSPVRYVIFGGGNAVARTLPSMTEWSERPHAVLYFGDIDAAGLSLAALLSALPDGFAALPPVLCAASLYERLIAKAGAMDLRLRGERVSEAEVERCCAWLPEALREAARTVLREGMRWPQEVLSADDIADALSLTRSGHGDGS